MEEKEIYDLLARSIEIRSNQNIKVTNDIMGYKKNSDGITVIYNSKSQVILKDNVKIVSTLYSLKSVIKGKKIEEVSLKDEYGIVNKIKYIQQGKIKNVESHGRRTLVIGNENYDVFFAIGRFFKFYKNDQLYTITENDYEYFKMGLSDAISKEDVESQIDSFFEEVDCTQGLVSPSDIQMIEIQRKLETYKNHLLSQLNKD